MGALFPRRQSLTKSEGRWKREEERSLFWCSTCSLLLGFKNPKLRPYLSLFLSFSFFLSFFLFPFFSPKKTRRLERFRKVCVLAKSLLRHKKTFDFSSRRRERLRKGRGCCSRLLRVNNHRARFSVCLSGSEKHHQLLYCCPLVYTTGDKSKNRRRRRREG